MGYFERIARSLSRALNGVAAASIVSMMLLTCADVILRLFQSPITGTYEIVSFLGAVTISFALAKTTLDRGHIAVQILMIKLPPMAHAVITWVTQILSIGLFGLISWQSAEYAGELWRTGEVSQTIAMPFFPIVYGIAFTSAVVCLVILVELLNLAPRRVMASDTRN